MLSAAEVNPTLVVPTVNVLTYPTPISPTIVAAAVMPQVVLPSGSSPVDSQTDSTVIIEGAIQQINDNIIVIYDTPIQVDATNPILSAIQIGDLVRVEGNVAIGSGNVIVIAANVAIRDADVAISADGMVWRDPGDCRSPPPSWAPAPSWRERCGAGASSIGNPGFAPVGGGMGDNGMGKGMGDD